MASKTSRTTLNAKNLQALGAERLAELLMEIAAGDSAIKRKLRMELAAGDPVLLSREIRKRLMTHANARTYVPWNRIKAVADDLDDQRRAIVDKVGKTDAAEALDLLWRFMALAEPIHDRCDDSNGTVGEVFRLACRDLGAFAAEVKPDPIDLADRIYDALIENGFGQFDDLIEVCAPALGDGGLNRLKQRMRELAAQPARRPPAKERVTIGWSSSGPIFADEIAESGRKNAARMALKDIAALQRDADAYIAMYGESERKAPGIATNLARQLLAAGRPEEALAMLDAADRPRRPAFGEWDFSFDETRIDALDALGRTEEAQAARWAGFEKTLSADFLRAYLKKLPDFDDVEAEERAMEHALRHPRRLDALAFLIDWPALDRAAKLVLELAGKLDGDSYEILTPAADALSARYPLAATLALRAMIDFTLTHGRTTRYRHAARHLMECASLVSTVGDYGSIETHQAYVARLKKEHGRKHGFWSLVK
jgi:hypothetical protein